MARISSKKNRVWFAVAATVFVLALILQNQGRNWLCAYPGTFLWVSSAYSPHTSQHLFDPYSFTHFLHGFLFCWILVLIVPRWSRPWQFWGAVAIESGWEVLENSSFIIDRYRETTAALGYYGDTILNSFSDVLCCGVGFAVARSLGFVRSLVVFLVVETLLILLIRDSLLINILMLIYPLDSIKQWQTGH
jgi:hypothetical protein